MFLDAIPKKNLNSSAAKTPVLVSEWARETLGRHQSGRRRQTAILEKAWPKFDFTALLPTLKKKPYDPLWKLNARETKPEMRKRVDKFIGEMWKLAPEKHLGVITHGTFLGTLIEYLGGKLRTKRLRNTEVYGMVIGKLRKFTCDKNKMDTSTKQAKKGKKDKKKDKKKEKKDKEKEKKIEKDRKKK